MKKETFYSTFGYDSVAGEILYEKELKKVDILLV